MGDGVEFEASYLCDSCGEEIVVPIDPTAGDHQHYVEDCPVCCNPNVLVVEISQGQVHVFSRPEQDSQ
ncbi:MAG: CPXCG motif-containing cysteine-rich protein [Planctomycetota bacterium]|nr:CPXCG motif-containing cysteine-rich protein [Planctomycetota bacterium]